MKNYNVTDKTGKVVDCKVVSDEKDLLIITDDGTIIRTAVSGISIIGKGNLPVCCKAENFIPVIPEPFK